MLDLRTNNSLLKESSSIQKSNAFLTTTLAGDCFLNGWLGWLDDWMIGWMICLNAITCFETNSSNEFGRSLYHHVI